MKFKTTLFIILLISILSLTAVNASEDISQNTTISMNDGDAVLSDVYHYVTDYQTGESQTWISDSEDNIIFEETKCTVRSTEGIVLNASYKPNTTNGLKPMLYGASKGTYNATTGIWNIGDFYGTEQLNILSYNEHSSYSWEDFTKTETYSNFLKEYVELNQTNKLVNPNADDRMPQIIDLSLTGDFIGWLSNESEIANCTRNFTVKSEGGVAKDTTVEYVLERNFTFQYYEASKGAYDPISGIWDVGDVSDSETLYVYMTVDKTYLLSILGRLWNETSIIARTTSDEVYTSNNVYNTLSTQTIVVSRSDESPNTHQTHTSSSDYSDFITVNVNDGGESKEVSYSEYKNPTIGANSTETLSTSNTDYQNTNNNQNANDTDIQGNGNLTNNQTNTSNTNDSIENFTGNSNIDKTIYPSNSNILIILAVLILCVLGVVVFKKFKS